MLIMVVDGQGGRIGSTIIGELLSRKPDCEIIAVGTNSQATSQMMRAGASRGASGENPIAVNAVHADIITGPIGIISANALLGEITPRMAEAISGSDAEKVLIPVSRCRITVAGTKEMKMGEYIKEAADLISQRIGQSR
ncbi:MAG TPA: DUF3842 family protein [Lachnospiraceae bacterium]|nr:DUF3842 family protein [Lachnospiraceae bacterium]